ncbi:MAG: HD domain-containing protein [bacterium]|nr:HD domain-containing protein [bacterium]
MKAKPSDNFQHPSFVSICNAARAQGYSLYLVGGAVREYLLNPQRVIDNFDLLLLGDLQGFASNCAALLHSRVVEINPEFGTVLIPAGEVQFEISAPRSLRKATNPEPDLPDDVLAHDLLLRDFTVNALAIPFSPRRGEMIDLCGGAADLANKVIRTPIDPEITIKEDPLRILRAVRFASGLNFAIAPELLQVMHDQNQLLRFVSVERKTAELLKIVSTNRPSVGLKLLYMTGVLDVIAPEIAAMARLKQDRSTRHKDIFEHTLKVIDGVAEAEGELETRLAALLHDIGKPATRQYDRKLGWTFHGHEVIGERMVEKVGANWKLPNSTVEKVAKLVRLHMRPINLSDEGVTDSAVRRLSFQAGEDVVELIKLCRADVTSSDPRRVKAYLANFEKVVQHLKEVDEKDQMRSFQSPVRGETIMAETGLEPGPAVGKLKKMIESAIIDGIIPNEYDAALNYLRQIRDTVLRNLKNDSKLN